MALATTPRAVEPLVPMASFPLESPLAPCGRRAGRSSAGVMAQDICSSPGAGDLPAPALSVTPIAAQEGEEVYFWCQIVWKSPDTRIVFCKDGVEVHSLKARQGKGTYSMFFPMMSRSTGTYTCGYQHKDKSNQVRNSALSAPRILSFRGDLPAPDLFITPIAAQEGEEVLFQCQIAWKSPDTRIIFCKDGVEVSSLKAQQQKGSYSMLFPMTSGSTGTYTCGYQHKDKSNRVRNSALSAPQNLSVTAMKPQGLQTFSPHLVIGLVTIFLLLLAAATYCFVRKGSSKFRATRLKGLRTMKCTTPPSPTLDVKGLVCKS
ncbi:uncharacterized protein LOC116800110 [Chiroxiphia lanceolata]|uniref:uncharacterized protein LOC116800110 n=1 Tax=Chiroxiphia lanceolata TaxID=296741 RepID=UPI0013CE60E9|nr:uncharacterized protein LOC116800110 [Chiroxiphia lanceolata]